MWEIKTSDEYLRRFKLFDKRKNKRVNELRAVHLNLERYLESLNSGVSPKQIQGGFVHPEPEDVVALTENCPAPETDSAPLNQKNLVPFRLYLYPDTEQKVLYLLTVGDKTTQPDDIAYCKNLVRKSIRKSQEDHKNPKNKSPKNTNPESKKHE